MTIYYFKDIYCVYAKQDWALERSMNDTVMKNHNMCVRMKKKSG